MSPAACFGLMDGVTVCVSHLIRCYCGQQLTLKYRSGHLICILLVVGMLVAVEYGNFGRLVVADGGVGQADVSKKLLQLDRLVMKELDAINRVLFERHKSPLDCNRLDSLFGIDWVPVFDVITRKTDVKTRNLPNQVKNVSTG